MIKPEEVQNTDLESKSKSVFGVQTEIGSRFRKPKSAPRAGRLQTPGAKPGGSDAGAEAGRLSDARRGRALRLQTQFFQNCS